jgi:hypothetical protein
VDFSRLLRVCCTARSKEQGAQSKENDFFSHVFLAVFSFLIFTFAFLLNHPIRSHQHVRWDRQADLPGGGLRIDYKLKLLRLVHRQISRLGILQDFVGVIGAAPMEVIVVHPVGHETAGFHKFTLWVNG